MQEDDIIALGDKVELTLENNRVYKSMIQDMTGSELFLVATPSLKGRLAPLYLNDKISMSYFRESAVYTMTVEVVAFEKQGEVQFVWLLQITEPSRYQRRDAYRLPIRLKVKVREYVDGMEMNLPLHENAAVQNPLSNPIESVNTKDLSIGGISIMTKRKYKPGEKYLLEVSMDGSQDNVRQFLICAEVKRIIPSDDNKSAFIGMQFFGVTNNRSEILSRYVLRRQQILIKQQKLRGE